VAKAYGAALYNFTASAPLWSGGGGNYRDPANPEYPWNTSSLGGDITRPQCFTPFSPSND
jgi:hypothetical protein